MGAFSDRLVNNLVPVTTISIPMEYLSAEGKGAGPVVSITMGLVALDDSNIVRNIVAIDGVRRRAREKRAWWSAIGPRARMFVRLCLEESK